VTRARPRPVAEVLADRQADPCEHGGLPGRCPSCRTAPEPAAPRPRRRRRPKPKPPSAPPVQLTLDDADHQDPQ
jgi:hypothetical protein